MIHIIFPWPSTRFPDSPDQTNSPIFQVGGNPYIDNDAPDSLPSLQPVDQCCYELDKPFDKLVSQCMWDVSYGWISSFSQVYRCGVVSWCGQLSERDCKDHDSAKDNNNNQVDGQNDLLETMTLHTDRQTDMQTDRDIHRQ